MTTDSSEQTQQTAQVLLPAQRPSPEPSVPPVDHVRTHGRSCWWDLTECRWQCSRDG